MTDQSIAKSTTELEQALFVACLRLDCDADRQRYLAEQCPHDADMRARVRELLSAFQDDTSFLESPAADPGQPITPVQERPGTEIGPYRLLEQIGEGGMGVVYMAEQTKPVRRKVALKIIKPGMDTAQVVARFEAEQQALALMDHPFIAKVHDAGSTESGRPYFVMELVKGIPITKYCDQHHLKLRERLELFSSVCNAIQHAHMKGVIHRDIKPSNVLVELHDVTHVPKVIDFGVAKATNQQLTERTLFTHFEQLIGTPVYMSPEQAQLSGLDVDTRTDVYSLGVLLYEILTGTTPFDREALRAAGYDEMRRIIREEEPLIPSQQVSTLEAAALSTISDSRRLDVRELGHALRGELDWIATKCLDKDRSRRYESASALAADLHRYLQNEPVIASPPSKTYQLRKFLKRNKRAAMVAGFAAASVVVVMAGLAVNNWMIAEERNAARAAQMEAERQSAIAEAANDFINIDLLGSAGDHSKPNRDLKVRDVLDRAAATIGERFVDQPLVEASVHTTIGNAYRSLGEFDTAEQHLSQSLRLRQQELGDDHIDTLKAANSLAWAYHDQGEYERCRQLFKQTLQIAKTRHGEEHRVTLDSQLGVADLERHFGNFPQSEELSCEVLETCRRVLGAEHSRTLRAASLLALVLNAQGNGSDAKILQQAVADARREQLGAEHPHTLTAMDSLAATLRGLNRPFAAEDLYRQIVATQKRVLGVEHPDTISSSCKLAAVLNDLRRHTESEELLRELLETSRSRLGPEHPMTLRVIENLARPLAGLGREDEAEDLIQNVLDVRRQRFGSEHLETLQSVHRLGVFYENQQRFGEAEELFRELATIQERLFGKSNPHTLHSMKHLEEIAIARAEGQPIVRAPGQPD